MFRPKVLKMNESTSRLHEECVTRLEYFEDLFPVSLLFVVNLVHGQFVQYCIRSSQSRSRTAEDAVYGYGLRRRENESLALERGCEVSGR
jgi:hypothetical protein